MERYSDTYLTPIFGLADTFVCLEPSSAEVNQAFCAGCN
jgi:hypothetical protein